MKIPFLTPRSLSSYEVVSEDAVSLMKYNVELLKDQVKNITEELLRVKRENEVLKESLRLKQESERPATSLNPATSKVLPKITSFNEVRAKLESHYARKK